MEKICNKYASKIDVKIKSLFFIYSGNTINFDLKFEEQANIIDKKRNEMNILVYKIEENEFKCQKCGEKINIEKICKIIQLYLNQNDMLNELKNEIETINNNDTNKIKNKLKIINLIIDYLIDDNQRKIKNIQNDIKSIVNEIKNESKKTINKHTVIKGTFNVEDIYKDVTIFNQSVEDEGFDVYLNKEKINVIKSYNIPYQNFKYKGNYKFKIIFKNEITNCERIFQNCSNLISIDLSKFDTSNVTSMGWMFNHCLKLKEIKGIDRFNTSNVNKMNSMFQECNEIEYLDLSNFDTNNVTDMRWMFDECHKLKKIKGIKKINTSKVDNMKAMFQDCNEIECLDLSKFNTTIVRDMGWMFNKCHKLKEIKGINNFNTSKVNSMRAMFQACYEIEKLDLSNFDTTNVTDMELMFCNCDKLKRLNLSNFSINNNCKVENMFKFGGFSFFVSTKKCQLITNNIILKKIYE